MCFTGKCPYEKFLSKEQDCICLAPKEYCWFDKEDKMSTRMLKIDKGGLHTLIVNRFYGGHKRGVMCNLLICDRHIELDSNDMEELANILLDIITYAREDT